MERKKPYSLRLSDTERARLNALAHELGREPAVLLREILNKIAEGHASPSVPSAKPDFTLKFELEDEEAP